jgi:N-acetylmuramic acid 6-phosphate (MurNAc-6-P) etherase
MNKFLTCISHIVLENLSTCEQEVKQRISKMERSLEEIKEAIVNYMRQQVVLSYVDVATATMENLLQTNWCVTTFPLKESDFKGNVA